MVDVFSERLGEGGINARTSWYKVGTIEWHREDGPAREWDDGDKEWYQHGKLHRTDGPAVTWESGEEDYYIWGKIVTKEEYRLWQFLNSKNNVVAA